MLFRSNDKVKPTYSRLLVSSKARSKIRQKLKENENKMAQEGKDLLERRLKNWKLDFGDDDLAALIKKYKFKTANEFFSAIGSAQIDLTEIKTYLQDKDIKEQVVVDNHVVSKARRVDSSDFIVIGSNNSLKNIDYKMARCCNPVFGDEVFGFVTINEGIKIHRMTCPNAARLLNNYPHRVQKARWREDAVTNSFQTTLRIIAESESITNDVIQTISMFKTSIRSFLTKEMRTLDTEILATIFVPSNLELDKIIASLKKLKDVKQVTRQ